MSVEWMNDSSVPEGASDMQFAPAQAFPETE